MTPQIRAATAADVDAMQNLAVAAEMFSADEVGFIGAQFEATERNEVPGGTWLVIDAPDGVAGAAFYACEPFADRMWNLYFLVVAPERAGQGLGGQLVRFVEDRLRNLGEAEARTLVVETSSTPAYERTRAFYERLGYTKEAVIRQFYGPEDHKVVYWKSLVAPPDVV